LRRLLSILPKPSRYAGIEEGSVHKDPDAVRLRLALAFPDQYEVGMSYLGHKILYGIVNDVPDWWAERVFAPCSEAGRIMRLHRTPLCSLESGTPLADFDVLGFSLTHELCYTNVLYMLDLAGVPFYSRERLEGGYPLVIAGGGCALAAEPAAPFFDVMLLGDGEDLLPEFLRLFQSVKEKGEGKTRFLEQAAHIPGVYVPMFFKEDGPRRPPLPLRHDYAAIARRAVSSLDEAAYPVRQVIPFGAVHNRLALEIARGCTRGCRFCQAGMIYRPVRERGITKLKELLNYCLAGTGYDDVSYLSLSTGDFSALKTLFSATIERCSSEQISVSLPSLRIGSIDDAIMEKIADIRRTGVTLAPEAGSQRLRDVINKGISEEEIILHAQKLFEHGWQQIKLYFMVGLPTETDEDLLAIIGLCRKVRDAAGPGVKRLQVTAAISPFVPKAHTPFQWEEQLPLEETRRKINILFQAVRKEKRIKLRWHDPEMSFLEGLLSRGDRRLCKVVERAYNKGAIFCSWVDQFSLPPWLEAMREEGLSPDSYAAGLPLDASLPWEHLRSGVNKKFLLLERERAFKMELSEDCRYQGCRQCGVCDTRSAPSNLPKISAETTYANILNFAQRDQETHRVNLDEHGRVVTRHAPQNGLKNTPPALTETLTRKVDHCRVWYAKNMDAVNLSQLELQAVLERAMRRGCLPLAFSRGFKPAPLISFTRALPVGVASFAEWFSLYLREKRSAEQIKNAFRHLPLGLEITGAEKLPLGLRPQEAMGEVYKLEWRGEEQRRPSFNQACSSLAAAPDILWSKSGKKETLNINIRSKIRTVDKVEDEARLLQLDWSDGYVSPLALVRAALGLSLNGDVEAFSTHEFMLTKLRIVH
jgi:radical SAM family uncharacterized protein/radical SAM-linked protein